MNIQMLEKGLFFLIFIAALFIGIVAAEQEKNKEITGQLISFDSRNNSMIVEVADDGRKKQLTYKIAGDANWHLCIAEQCVDTKGDDGFQKLIDYVAIEAYCIPPRSYKAFCVPSKSYKTILTRTGNEVTGLHIEIVPGRHKDKIP